MRVYIICTDHETWWGANRGMVTPKTDMDGPLSSINLITDNCPQFYIEEEELDDG